MARMGVFQRKNSHEVQYLEPLVHEPSPSRPNRKTLSFFLRCVSIFVAFVTFLLNHPASFMTE
jgi:hypothetical protein